YGSRRVHAQPDPQAGIPRGVRDYRIALQAEPGCEAGALEPDGYRTWLWRRGDVQTRSFYDRESFDWRVDRQEWRSRICGGDRQRDGVHGHRGRHDRSTRGAELGDVSRVRAGNILCDRLYGAVDNRWRKCRHRWTADLASSVLGRSGGVAGSAALFEREWRHHLVHRVDETDVCLVHPPRYLQSGIVLPVLYSEEFHQPGIYPGSGSAKRECRSHHVAAAD